MQQLLGPDTGERRVIYLFSDFRTRQWDKPDDLKKRLVQLDANNAEIRLIDCVEDSGHPTWPSRRSSRRKAFAPSAFAGG